MIEFYNTYGMRLYLSISCIVIILELEQELPMANWIIDKHNHAILSFSYIL